MSTLTRLTEPNIITLRIRFEEIDGLKIVWYGNYFKYFSVGQQEWWRAAGYTPAKFEELGIHTAVLSTTATYYKTAKFDDLLTIQTTLETITKTKLTMLSKILRDDELIAEGSTTFFCMDLQGNLRRFPSEWVDA